jgi:hypothetical protein
MRGPLASCLAPPEGSGAMCSRCGSMCSDHMQHMSAWAESSRLSRFYVAFALSGALSGARIGNVFISSRLLAGCAKVCILAAQFDG